MVGKYERYAQSLREAQSFITTTKASTDSQSWAMSMKTYHQIQWLNHLSRLRPLPARKLRTCQMRRITRHLRAERRRYL